MRRVPHARHGSHNDKCGHVLCKKCAKGRMRGPRVSAVQTRQRPRSVGGSHFTPAVFRFVVGCCWMSWANMASLLRAQRIFPASKCRLRIY